MGDSQSISLYVYNGSHPTINCFLILTSHFTENTASINYKDPSRRWIINCVGVHAEYPCFCPILTAIVTYSQILIKKCSQILMKKVFINITKNASNEISGKAVRWESLCSTRTDGQRRTTRLTEAFRNCFASEFTNHDYNTKLTCHKQGT